MVLPLLSVKNTVMSQAVVPFITTNTAAVADQTHRDVTHRWLDCCFKASSLGVMTSTILLFWMRRWSCGGHALLYLFPGSACQLKGSRTLKCSPLCRMFYSQCCAASLSHIYSPDETIVCGLKGPLTSSGWLLLDKRARLRSLWLCVCVCKRERVLVNEALCSPPNTSSPKAVKWTLSHNSQGSAPRRGDSGPGWSRHGDGPCGKSILGERGNWGEGAEQGLKEEQINFAVWSRTGSE